jgi:hypothetical protein
MVRLIRIRTVTNDGPLFPLKIDDPNDVLGSYLDLVSEQPGFAGWNRYSVDKSYVTACVLDTIANARALHRLLTDRSVPAVNNYEDLIAATAASSRTQFETTWRMTP